MMRSGSLLPLSLCLSLCAVVCGCTGGYSRFSQLPQNGWAYGVPVNFETDTTLTGALSLAICHSNDFEFKRLLLEVTCDSIVDTVSIDVADDSGRWLGYGGVGDNRQVTVPMPFTPRQSSKVSVRHIMRIDTLRGINQIGLVEMSK